MLGLIKKDLLMTKSNLKTIALILIVYLFVAAGGNGGFAFIPSFMSIVIMMSTFSYDEYNKTNAFISVLPNGKQNAVKSKYLATLLILAISILVTIPISVLPQISNNSINWEEIFSTIIGCCFSVILMQSLFYPLIFKYGIEKGRMAMFIGVFLLTGIGTLLIKNGFSIHISGSIFKVLDHYWMILIPAVSVILLLISYTISKHFYLKKEF